MTVNRLVFKCVDSNTYKFCGGETNKFCLMSQKVVYPYERMNSWERFNEKSLTDRKEIYMNLTMEEMLIKSIQKESGETPVITAISRCVRKLPQQVHRNI